MWLYRAESPDEAGLYSLSVKLAGIVVFTVRAFQYAWPPLAYSIVDDDEARAGLRAHHHVLRPVHRAASSPGSRCSAAGLVRLFAAPEFYAAHEALTWVALGWALYGLFLVLVAMAGRAQVTVRNAPAALCGLVVNVVLLVVLVPSLGIAGAGLALVGAYAVMLVAMWALTHKLFPVAFEWRRLLRVVVVVGGLTVAGELLLPTDGVGGLPAPGARRWPRCRWRWSRRASSGRASCAAARGLLSRSRRDPREAPAAG